MRHGIVALLAVAIIAGVTNSERYRRRFHKRVIGGSSTGSDEEQPYLVALKGTAGGWFWSKSYRYCGGSVINDEWVLTAAHCFDDLRNPKDWEVRLASRKLSGGIIDRIGDLFGKVFGNKDWQEFTRDVNAIVVHSGYNPNSLWENDIAMMHLSKPVPSGPEFDQIKAVPVPEQGVLDWPVDQQRCMMIGWGCSEAGGSVEKKSMKVDLPKVSDEECQATWGVPAVKRMCAGQNFANKGICPGDSGGPLVCELPGKGWYQAGIASFTSKNTPGDRPGAFTRVSHYADWISAVTQSRVGK